MYQQYMNDIEMQISNLSSDELKELLNDDEKLEEKINESLKSLEDEKTNLLIENRELAENNLGKEAQIIELKSKINELSQNGKELCSQLQDKISEFQEKSGSVNKETALALLQTAAAEAEEQSDNLNKSFLENEITLEQYLEQFLTLRKTMHLRKIKAEKLNDIIKNHSNRGNSYIPSTGFFNNQPSGLPYPTGGISGVPYPTGPMMGMPMPMPPRPF